MLKNISTCCSIIIVAPTIAFTYSESLAATAIRYVNIEASNDGNGLSWNSPRKYLQDGLTQAADHLQNFPTDTVQLWVAAGTYRPDEDALNPSGTGVQGLTFELRTNIEIYGGFDTNDTQLNDRDPATNITILSGDLSQNDGANFSNYADNSYHVVTASFSVDFNANGSPHIDGFVIQSGNASLLTGGSGGGVFIESGGQAYVRGCTMKLNWGENGGGAAVVDNGSVGTFRKCVFTQNRGDDFGGGLYVIFGDALLSNCTLTFNTALFGGGIGADSPNDVDLANCNIDQNDAEKAGGGIYISDTPSNETIQLMNCAVTRNSLSALPGLGGGVHFTSVLSASIRNATIANNDAITGGGYYQANGTTTIDNTIVWGNTADSDDSIEHASGTLTVCHSDVEGNWTAGSSCSGSNIDANPNFANASSGDFRLVCDSPCINTGNNSAIPADFGDIDDDGNLTEDTPWDLDLNPRKVTVVDRGSFETPAAPCFADCAKIENMEIVPGQDGAVNVNDLLLVINQWGDTCPCGADIAPQPCLDNHVNVDDLLAVISQWGECGGVAGSMPETIQDCFDACNHLSGSAWQLCTEECINKVCENHPEECE